MDRAPVSSSNIHSVGYDSSSMTLEIEFRSGGVYQYFEVPESVYEELLHASSKGSYFHQHVKDRYHFQRVT